MNKPQRTCQIKITTENRDENSFYFFAPQRIAEQMKEFGYLHYPQVKDWDEWELDIDPRFKYEDVKAYLLSLGEEHHENVDDRS